MANRSPYGMGDQYGRGNRLSAILAPDAAAIGNIKSNTQGIAYALQKGWEGLVEGMDAKDQANVAKAFGDAFKKDPEVTMETGADYNPDLEDANTDVGSVAMAPNVDMGRSYSERLAANLSGLDSRAAGRAMRQLVPGMIAADNAKNAAAHALMNKRKDAETANQWKIDADKRKREATETHNMEMRRLGLGDKKDELNMRNRLRQETAYRIAIYKQAIDEAEKYRAVGAPVPPDVQRVISGGLSAIQLPGARPGAQPAPNVAPAPGQATPMANRAPPQQPRPNQPGVSRANPGLTPSMIEEAQAEGLIPPPPMPAPQNVPQRKSLAEYQLEAKGKEKQATEMGKLRAKAEFDMPSVLHNSEVMLKALDALVAPAVGKDGKIQRGPQGRPIPGDEHAGFESAVGARGPMSWNTYLPFVEGPIWGTDAADFDAALKFVQGKQFMTAFQSLKGGGQITETEGEKATSALANLTKSQSEKQFKKALMDFRYEVGQLVELAKRKAGGQAAAPSQQGGGLVNKWLNR